MSIQYDMYLSRSHAHRPKNCDCHPATHVRNEILRCPSAIFIACRAQQHRITVCPWRVRKDHRDFVQHLSYRYHRKSYQMRTYDFHGDAARYGPGYAPANCAARTEQPARTPCSAPTTLLLRIGQIDFPCSLTVPIHMLKEQVT